jgi:hypothetical protein
LKQFGSGLNCGGCSIGGLCKCVTDAKSEAKLLKCPFCDAMVSDFDFTSHQVQRHPEQRGEVGGSYIRWLHELRVKAGGHWELGVGQGDGMGQTKRRLGDG